MKARLALLEARGEDRDADEDVEDRAVAHGWLARYALSAGDLAEARAQWAQGLALYDRWRSRTGANTADFGRRLVAGVLGGGLSLSAMVAFIA